MMKIPVNTPIIAPNAKKYVNDCIDTGWISSAGEYVNTFEARFAAYLGVKHAIAVNTGTAALHAALAALGVKAGDEVIVPSFTMVASAFAVMYLGAKPVFVDCSMDTWNIDVQKIEAKISDTTKAIMPVHIYGVSCDMDPILELAKKYNLAVIEDAAEVHGAEYKGKKCGSIGDVGCFSFYANKIITTGEGGMVVTNDDTLAEKIRRFKDLCHSPAKRFVHTDLGFNYRFSNILAALGLAQLEEIDAFLQKKDHMGQKYTDLLQDIPSLTVQITPTYSTHVYWMFGVVLNEQATLTRDELRAKLLERGIETRDFFYPLHTQPAISALYSYDDSEFPVSNLLADQGFYLPSGLALSDEEIEYVGQVLHEILC